MEESEKKKVAKQLKKAAGRFWCRRRAGRRWPSFSTTTGLEAETAATVAGAALLRRGYCSTTTTTTDAGDDEKPPPGRGGVGARLSRTVKQQRARLYIAGRCVSMLVCWRDVDDN